LDLGHVDEDMSQIVDKAARINIALPQRHGVPLKTKVRALTAAEVATLTYHVDDPTAVTCPEPDE
jgi:hypothetical protein